MKNIQNLSKRSGNQNMDFLNALCEAKSLAFLKLSTLQSVNGVTHAMDFLDDVVIDINNNLNNKMQILALALESLEQGVSLGELIALVEQRVEHYKTVAFRQGGGLFEQIHEHIMDLGTLPDSVICQVSNQGNETIFEIKKVAFDYYLSANQRQFIQDALYSHSNELDSDMSM